MASDYAFIRAYGKFIGARESFVDDLVRQARRENIGYDVYNYDKEAKRWLRFPELEEKGEAGDVEAAAAAKKIREIMR
ncbi:hypothetical protein [Methylovirgula sp. HY1]|uniref:hypothetical protein n=1 Tax=Methylovirgula sp. HY1 TaxID=2822761 RepID=UPI001C5AA62D|nr:hypothetical protein [Methylovirgula sp. HY1]QXX75767.1 hypothetical protein MHY1_02598 [Methylovirgula sp. HY1]